MEGNRVDAIFEFLSNDHTKGIARGIRFHDDLFRPVWGAEDRVIATNFLKTQEGIIAFLGPDELLVLASEVVERVRNIGEILDKGAVEVAETQETSYILDCQRSGPIGDSLNLDRVHFDRAITNEYPEVLDFTLMKPALLGLEEEVELF